MKLILENFRKFVNEEEIASIAGQDMPLEALYDDVLDKIILVLNTAYGEDNYNLYKILTDLAEFHARGRISENDDKVSKKISYLMDKEGKPQKQAVAMALDMEERGKLEEARMRWDREISAAAQELGAPAGFVELVHQALLSAAADYMDQAQMEMADALGMLLAGVPTGELE